MDNDRKPRDMSIRLNVDDIMKFEMIVDLLGPFIGEDISDTMSQDAEQLPVEHSDEFAGSLGITSEIEQSEDDVIKKKKRKVSIEQQSCTATSVRLQS
jgi:hypothetical protein